MRRSVEVSGKTVEEVLERASRYFDVPKENLSYEVLSENRGFLGILVPRTVRVRVWVESTDNPIGESAPIPVTKKEQTNNKVDENSNKNSEYMDEENYQDLEKAREKIRDFFENLIKKMNINIEYHVRENGKKVFLEIDGVDAGLLIGKHGETLEALESFLKIFLVKNGYAHIGLEVDVSGYKKRREETLTKLACKMATKVVQGRRRFKFEPMNARERRIIHTTLKDHPKIITYSIGEEPERRVVVDLKSEKRRDSNQRKRPTTKKKAKNE
ncbi:MAG: KH domain-containing protein [Candidatus Atribacteria bacterium]|nr:KH domain-containing protein [Candidatus Atribacteria bacterium]